MYVPACKKLINAYYLVGRYLGELSSLACMFVSQEVYI